MVVYDEFPDHPEKARFALERKQLVGEIKSALNCYLIDDIIYLIINEYVIVDVEKYECDYKTTYTLINNQIHGMKYSWYPSGKKCSVFIYHGGQRDGIAKVWHGCGIKCSVRRYKHNLLNGRTIIWNRHGFKQSSNWYSNGRIVLEY